MEQRKRDRSISACTQLPVYVCSPRAVCVPYPCTTRGGKLVQWNLELRGRCKYRRNQRLRPLLNAANTPFGLSVFAPAFSECFAREWRSIFLVRVQHLSARVSILTRKWRTAPSSTYVRGTIAPLFSFLVEIRSKDMNVKAANFRIVLLLLLLYCLF